MRRYSAPTAMISVSDGDTKTAISHGAQTKTTAETSSAKTVVIITALEQA